MMVLCLYMSHLSDLLGSDAWESCLGKSVEQHILVVNKLCTHLTCTSSNRLPALPYTVHQPP